MQVNTNAEFKTATVALPPQEPAKPDNKNAKGKKSDRQEDFDDVDESEIDYEGEEKAHDRVNQIPNSQVNRNQQNKNSEFKDAPRSESQMNSMNSYP